MNIAQSPTFRKAVKAAAILSAFVIFTAVCTNLRHILQTDFVSFWAAAKLALGGNPLAAYDIESHKAMELTAVAVDGTIPFTYPPPYLFAILPFGLFSYAIAHAIWVGTTLSAYLTAVHKLAPNSALLAMAFPPAMICGIGGQNSFLLAAIFMLGMVCLKSLPFAAGLMLGLIVIKPHLGLLLPLALLAGREWRAFAGATISTLGLMLLSAVAFGPTSWTKFIELLPFASQIASAGLVSWAKMASIYASLRLAGFPEAIAFGVHIVFAVAASVIVWQVWRRSTDLMLRAAVLSCATLMISPYLFIYDQVFLVPAIAHLWRRGGSEKPLAMLYIISLVSLAGSFQSVTNFNLAPVLPTILLWLMWRQRNKTVEPDGFRPLSAQIA
jgi:alpha-1,2-mannosyltransferase